MHNPEGNPPWGIFDIVAVYAGSILLTVLIGLIIRVTGVPAVLDDTSLFELSALVQFGVTVSLVFIIALKIKKAHPYELGLKKPTGGELIKYGLGGGFFLFILIFLLGIPIAQLQPELAPQLYEEVLSTATSSGDIVYLFLIGVVLAPVSEEIFYRGMVYPVMRRYAGPVWGAILAGLVFGLAHWDLWRTIPLAAGGAILCYIYEKTGSIWVSSVSHGLWNAIMAMIVLAKWTL